jgi:hypothetical protein
VTRQPLALALTACVMLSACSLPSPSLKPASSATPTPSAVSSLIRIFSSEDVIAAVTAVGGSTAQATTVPRLSGDKPPIVIPADCAVLNEVGIRGRMPTGWQVAVAGDVVVAFKVMDRHFADVLGDQFAVLASATCSQVQLDDLRLTVTANEQFKPRVQQGRSYGIRLQSSSSSGDVSVWQGSNLVIWASTNENPSASPQETTKFSAMNQVLAELGLT